MTQPETKIQAYSCNKGTIKNYWVVFITSGNKTIDERFIHCDGTTGREYKYFTKGEAQNARSLFYRNERVKESKTGTSAELKAERTCADCNNQATCHQIKTQPASTCAGFVPILGERNHGLFLDKSKEIEEMRKFESGATRNTVEGRLNYVKALSPIVLERYVQYLGAHREQVDGTMRDFDNWKKGIPTSAYLEGLGRHFISVWLLAQGFSAEDNKGLVNLEDTLCAIIFNSMGWLHEILKEKRSEISSTGSISAEELRKELQISERCFIPEYRANVGCTECLNENCKDREKSEYVGEGPHDN